MTTARSGLLLLERPLLVEAAFWRRLRLEGDEACRTALFDLYVGRARAIARHEMKRRPSYGLDRGDFEQLAFSGLLEAIDRFDPMRGAPFDAFARHRIRGAIADGIAKSSENAAQFGARRRLEQERLRDLRRESPGESSIAELAELASALAIGMIAENARLEYDGEGAGLYQSVAWRDLELQIIGEIDNLPETERTVVRQHYLNDVPFTEIAQLLKLSKGRVAQLHRAAIMRIRLRVKRDE